MSDADKSARGAFTRVENHRAQLKLKMMSGEMTRAEVDLCVFAFTAPSVDNTAR